MRYVGLTDDPNRRKQEHGNPKDFRVILNFSNEIEAVKWEKGMLARGYRGDTGGKGWRHGYTFSK
jgi:predicted GIY-YIG superfamily endonuclease